MELNGGSLSWCGEEGTALDNLPDDIIYTVLHYLYGECLPPQLSIETAEKCSTIVDQYPSLLGLSNMCTLYIQNIQLKNSE